MAQITIVDILLHPAPKRSEQSRWKSRIDAAERLIETLHASLELAQYALEQAIWPPAVQAGSVLLAKASLELAEAAHYLERLHYEASARGMGELNEDGEVEWHDFAEEGV